MSVFDPTFDLLPTEIPIFPLGGAIVLPKTNLPLNIFEPRYLAMTATALGGSRMIGMIQPKETEAEAAEPAVYQVGCAGRIVQFEESEDGRFLINLKGVCRFRIAEELPPVDGYRRIRPDWTPFRDDLEEASDEGLTTDRLMMSLKPYFDDQGISANWDAIKETPANRLVNSLAMVCPFEPLEKQALLEAKTIAERLTVLTQLIEMAVLDTSHEDSTRQ